VPFYKAIVEYLDAEAQQQQGRKNEQLEVTEASAERIFETQADARTWVTSIEPEDLGAQSITSRTVMCYKPHSWQKFAIELLKAREDPDHKIEFEGEHEQAYPPVQGAKEKLTL